MSKIVDNLCKMPSFVDTITYIKEHISITMQACLMLGYSLHIEQYRPYVDERSNNMYLYVFALKRISPNLFQKVVYCSKNQTRMQFLTPSEVVRELDYPYSSTAEISVCGNRKHVSIWSDTLDWQEISVAFIARVKYLLNARKTPPVSCLRVMVWSDDAIEKSYEFFRSGQRIGSNVAYPNMPKIETLQDVLLANMVANNEDPEHVLGFLTNFLQFPKEHPWVSYFEDCVQLNTYFAEEASKKSVYFMV